MLASATSSRRSCVLIIENSATDREIREESSPCSDFVGCAIFSHDWKSACKFSFGDLIPCARLGRFIPTAERLSSHPCKLRLRSIGEIHAFFSYFTGCIELRVIWLLWSEGTASIDYIPMLWSIWNDGYVNLYLEVGIVPEATNTFLMKRTFSQRIHKKTNEATPQLRVVVGRPAHGHRP